jgi:DNA polymerase III epsilon subunit-like protein
MSSTFSNANYVLIFDVETNGFPPRYAVTNLASCPNILQMSWVIYCCTTKTIIESFDSYVKIDPEVTEISEKITEINHCTYERCAGGMPMTDILQDFYQAYHRCDWIVAHNIQFDSKMVFIEFMRNWSDLNMICPEGLRLFRDDYVSTVQKRIYCTMNNSIQLCKLPHADASKTEYFKRKNGTMNSTVDNYKYPKLIELYQYLFGREKEIEGLHNSMVDVQVCLQCFLKMV